MGLIRSVASHPGGGGSELGWVEHYTGAGTGFPDLINSSTICGVNQVRSQPSRWGGGLNLDGWNTIQARVQDFLKGGGVFLGHCPRDVIRPPEN